VRVVVVMVRWRWFGSIIARIRGDLTDPPRIGSPLQVTLRRQDTTFRVPALEPGTLKGVPRFRREGVLPFCRNGVQAAGSGAANAGAETFGGDVGAAEVGADTGQVLRVGDHESLALGPPYNTSSTPIPQASNGSG